MSRSIRKGPYVEFSLLKKIEKVVADNDRTPIMTKSRRSVIIPLMVGLTIKVYNGKVYVPLIVSEEMVGFKLGVFSLTRLFKAHSGDRKTK
jgi:small subunit ribosomal protein S19